MSSRGISSPLNKIIFLVPFLFCFCHLQLFWVVKARAQLLPIALTTCLLYESQVARYPAAIVTGHRSVNTGGLNSTNYGPILFSLSESIQWACWHVACSTSHVNKCEHGPQATSTLMRLLFLKNDLHVHINDHFSLLSCHLKKSDYWRSLPI